MSTAGDDILTRATTLGTRLDEAGKAAAAGAEALSGKGVILSGSIDEIAKAMDAANMSYDKAAGRFKSLATGKFINFASAEKAIQEGLEAGLKGGRSAIAAAGTAAGASGLVGKIFQTLGSSLLVKGLTKIIGWPLSLAELGKDIMDVTLDKEAMKKDVTAKVKNEDTFAIAGSLIGGAFGAFLGPLGIAAGASIGNLIGEQIGKALDKPDVKDAFIKAKTEIESEITIAEDQIKLYNEKMKGLSLSDETGKYYRRLREMKQNELDGLNDEKKKLDVYEKEINIRDKAAAEVNKLKQDLIEVSALIQEESDSKAREQLIALKAHLKGKQTTAQATFAGATAQARLKGADLGIEGIDAEIDIQGFNLKALFDKDVRELDTKELNEQLEENKKEMARTIQKGKGQREKTAEEKLPYQMNIKLLEAALERKTNLKTEAAKLASIQKQRWGGGLNSDKPYFVGEAGPELWNPTMGDLIPSRNILGPALNRMSASNTLAGTIGGGMNGGGMNSVINAPSTIIQNVQQNELSDPYSWGHASMLRESA